MELRAQTCSCVSPGAIVKRRPLLRAYSVNFNFHLVFVVVVAVCCCGCFFFFSSYTECVSNSRPFRYLFGMCVSECMCVCVCWAYFRTFSFSCYDDIEIAQNQIAWLANGPISSAILSLTETMYDRQTGTHTHTFALMYWKWVTEKEWKKEVVIQTRNKSTFYFGFF